MFSLGPIRQFRIPRDLILILQPATVVEGSLCGEHGYESGVTVGDALNIVIVVAEVGVEVEVQPCGYGRGDELRLSCEVGIAPSTVLTTATGVHSAGPGEGEGGGCEKVIIVVEVAGDAGGMRGGHPTLPGIVDFSLGVEEGCPTTVVERCGQIWGKHAGAAVGADVEVVVARVSQVHLRAGERVGWTGADRERDI